MERGLIAPEDIAKVRAATSLVGLFEEVTAVKRQGSRFVALCPFHDERTASLSIDEALGVYHCFGCGASGDAIGFVAETKSFDFREAVEWLADRAGVSISYQESDEARASRIRHRKLHEAVGSAAGWYQQQLLEAPEARGARDYLRSRGWTGEVARRFGVGWAPASGEGAVRALRLPADVAYEAGIAQKDQSNRPYDLLRGRIVFPIFEPGGKPVALAGRVLPGADGPKYVNFPETPLYAKRRILYGLNWAKKAIAVADEVIVCEGYTDVISFHLAGLERAVATCGIALTEDHVKLLARFAKRIVVAYDADSAGQGGVERLHQWEARHRVEFAVVTLPAGEDPATLVEGGRANELVEAVAEARPLLGWRVDRLLGSSRLDTPEGRIAAADAAMTMINAHPNELLREQYAVVVAERCQIDPGRLKPRRPSVRRDHAQPGARRGRPLSGPEFEALRLAVTRPSEVAWLIPQLVSEPLALRLLDVLRATATLADAVRVAAPDVASVIAQMSMEPAEGDPEALRSQLTVAAAMRAIAQLVRASTRSSADTKYLLEVSTWLRTTASMVTEAGEEGAPEAVEALWNWLAEQPAPEIPGGPVATPESGDADLTAVGAQPASTARAAASDDEPPLPPVGYYDFEDYDEGPPG